MGSNDYVIRADEEETSSSAMTLDALERSAGERTRILITGGTVLTMDGEVGDFVRADVLIEGTLIAAVGRDLGHSVRDGQGIVVSAEGMIVMPGMQDTHRHCWQSQLRRLVAGFDLDEYIDVILGHIAPHYRPEDVHAGNLVSALAALDAGITCVLDFSHNSRSAAHSDAAIAALHEAGIRAIHASGPPLFGDWEMQWPRDLTRLKKEYFNSDDQLLTLRSGLLGSSDLGGDGYALTPKSISFARALGIQISVDGVFGPAASSNVEELGRAHLLGPDITLIHCNDLSDNAWEMIAHSGVHVSLCPTSDAQIGIYDALPPIQKALDWGIKPALSVDVECALSSDMFTQMQSIYTTQRMSAFNRRYHADVNAPAPIDVRDVLEMATVNGARANGLLHKSGTLTPGKEADIVLLGAQDINTMPLNNAAATVVLGADTGNVDSVFVAGQVRKYRGQLLRHELNRVRRLVTDSRDHLIAESGYSVDILARRAATAEAGCALDAGVTINEASPRLCRQA